MSTAEAERADTATHAVDAPAVDPTHPDFDPWAVDLRAGLDPVRHADFIATLDRLEEEERARRRMQRLRELGVRRAPRRTRPLDFRDQRGASPPLAVRLPRWLDEQLRRAFEELGVTPSEGLRQIVEEWCVVRLFPALEYRDDRFIRLASIRGGPDLIEWLTSPRPAELSDEARRQVQDYAELFRGRLEAELRCVPERVRARAAERPPR